MPAAGAIIGAVISAAASAAIAASQKGPTFPDSGAGAQALSAAQAAALPTQRQLEAAAQEGIATNIPLGFTATQMVQMPDGTVVPYDSSKFSLSSGTEAAFSGIAGSLANGFTQPGAGTAKNVQYVTDQNGQVGRMITQWVPSGGKVDFTGYGTADIEAAQARRAAQSQLDLQEKYGGKFIDQALAEEKLADPQGFAARQKENELIQQQINDKPQRPVADMLNNQVMDQISAARNGKLDSSAQGTLYSSARAAMASRGGQSTPGADFSEPLTTGFAGEKLQSDSAQKGLSWLSSGATPEDVEYRREMQNLANLSAMVNGTTPESQFKSLSGAQQGPAPVVNGQPLSQLPNGQGGAANSVATSMWNTNLNNQLQQINPWSVGLSAIGSGATIAGSMGWQPLVTGASSTAGG